MNIVVGISVYQNDSSESLRAAFDSIYPFANGCACFLCIFVDGRVCDELRLVIVEYSKLKFVHVLWSKTNIGLACGLNKLLKYGSRFEAKYYFRMDADDIALPGRFERQIEFMESNPNIDVCGGPIVEFSGEYCYEVSSENSQRVVPQLHEQIYSGLARTATFNHPTVCFRYSSLSKWSPDLKVYDECVGLAEDYKLWVDLATAGFKFANIAEPLLAFRITEDFYKRRSSVRAFAEHRVRMDAMKRLKLFSISNLLYAYGVLIIRLMPPFVIKFAYKFKRKLDSMR